IDSFNATVDLERRTRKRKQPGSPSTQQTPKKKKGSGKLHKIPVDAIGKPNLACWAYHTLWAIEKHGAPKIIEKDSTVLKTVNQRRRHSCPNSRAAHILPFYTKKFSAKLSCNKQYKGFQCDEYPPAASVQGGSASVARATAMCIPGPSNGAGGQLHRGIPNGDKFEFVFKQNLAGLEDACKQYIEHKVNVNGKTEWKFP
ncbi:hypothetical protein HDU97_007219, partial [Phlyctochytrium planicorne]